MDQQPDAHQNGRQGGARNLRLGRGGAYGSLGSSDAKKLLGLARAVRQRRIFPIWQLGGKHGQMFGEPITLSFKMRRQYHLHFDFRS